MKQNKESKYFVVDTGGIHTPLNLAGYIKKLQSGEYFHCLTSYETTDFNGVEHETCKIIIKKKPVNPPVLNTTAKFFKKGFSTGEEKIPISTETAKSLVICSKYTTFYV